MPFRLPTRTVLAPGCLAQLPEVAAGYAPRRILLVTDRGLEQSGIPERVRRDLANSGLAVDTFDEIEPNPRHTTVDRLARRGAEIGAGLVVGLGGGSVLDAAKAAAMLIANGGRCEDFEGRNRFTQKPLPFVAVPTTCGTGSEVTWVAVISHQERLWKMSLKGDGMFPDWALVDADLLATLPPSLVAWTGLDALTHALEATTCRAANPASDALAARAIGLVFRHLQRAVADIAGDAEAREGMAQASTIAGMGFGNSDVAAVHCLSETLGARYDLPHGLLNAVLLVPVLRWQRPAIEARLAALADALPAAGAPAAAVTADQAEKAERVLLSIEGLAAAVGTPPFRDLSIPTADFPWIAKRAADNGSNPSNARPMGPAEYQELLESLA
jgi:alcohol dehydrogenase